MYWGQKLSWDLCPWAVSNHPVSHNLWKTCLLFTVQWPLISTAITVPSLHPDRSMPCTSDLMSFCFPTALSTLHIAESLPACSSSTPGLSWPRLNPTSMAFLRSCFYFSNKGDFDNTTQKPISDFCLFKPWTVCNHGLNSEAKFSSGDAQKWSGCWSCRINVPPPLSTLNLLTKTLKQTS